MIRLDSRDARPIYEQVMDSLRRLVVSGAIQPGEKLPSVRAMATTLAINPSTIQRAYESLAAEGYLHPVAGKGCFAADRGDIQGRRRETLLNRFDQTAAELIFLGLSPDELSRRLHAVSQP